MAKTVVITGASKGIGRETAIRFAEEGYTPVITYRSDEKGANETSRICLDKGSPETMILELDVTSDASIMTAVRRILSRYGRISVLVNNAGVAVSKPLAEQTSEDIEKQLRTNLEGMIKITKELLPYIDDAIVNVSSGAGKHGYGGISVYSASKFGVRGFTQSLAQETGINVYSVNPGMTATQMTDKKGRPADEIAEIIYDAAAGKYQTESGGDIDAH